MNDTAHQSAPTNNTKRNTKIWLIVSQTMLVVGAIFWFLSGGRDPDNLLRMANLAAPFIAAFVAVSALTWFLYVKEKYGAARIIAGIPFIAAMLWCSVLLMLMVAWYIDHN